METGKKSESSLFILSASFFALLLFFNCEAHESHDCLFFNCNYTLRVLWKWKKTGNRLTGVMQQLLSISLSIKGDYETISKSAPDARLLQSVACATSNGQDLRHTADCLSRGEREIDQFEFWRGDERIEKTFHCGRTVSIKPQRHKRLDFVYLPFMLIIIIVNWNWLCTSDTKRCIQVVAQSGGRLN